MRTAQRNKRSVWYCLYTGETEQTDSAGNYTGEVKVNYAAPVWMAANVSPATGQSSSEMFGNLQDYDKVIVTDWISCPIDENSVLFVDTTPTEESEKGYDYIVRRVAKSINSLSIAISKVKMGWEEEPEPEPTPVPDEPSEPNDGE